MNYGELIREHKFLKSKVISLSKFLSRYLYITGEDLTKMTHKEIFALFDFLERSSFDYIEENIDCIYEGEVALVSDGKTVIPYFIPELDYQEKEYFQIHVQRDGTIKIDDSIYDYTSLSEYELRQLLRKRFSSARNQYFARKELTNRGIEITKKYKRNNKIERED